MKNYDPEPSLTQNNQQRQPPATAIFSFSDKMKTTFALSLAAMATLASANGVINLFSGSGCSGSVQSGSYTPPANCDGGCVSIELLLTAVCRLSLLGRRVGSQVSGVEDNKPGLKEFFRSIHSFCLGCSSRRINNRRSLCQEPLYTD